MSSLNKKQLRSKNTSEEVSKTPQQVRIDHILLHYSYNSMLLLNLFRLKNLLWRLKNKNIF